jgi:hypothetical protein
MLKDFFRGVRDGFINIVGLPVRLYRRLDGVKTYLALGLGLAVQIVQILPANTLSTALGLNSQQSATLTTIFLLLAFYGRAVAKPKGPDNV